MKLIIEDLKRLASRRTRLLFLLRQRYIFFTLVFLYRSVYRMSYTYMKPKYTKLNKTMVKEKIEGERCKPL